MRALVDWWGRWGVLVAALFCLAFVLWDGTAAARHAESRIERQAQADREVQQEIERRRTQAPCAVFVDPESSVGCPR